MYVRCFRGPRTYPSSGSNEKIRFVSGLVMTINPKIMIGFMERILNSFWCFFVCEMKLQQYIENKNGIVPNERKNIILTTLLSQSGIVL